MPPACLVGSPSVCKGEETTSPLPVLTSSVLPESGRSRYGVQQEPVFSLRGLLSSVHSVREELEERGIKPAEECSSQIHVTPMSLHSWISQPDTSSGCPEQATAQLALSTTHVHSHSPLCLLQGLQCFQQEKKKIIQIAIIKKNLQYSLPFGILHRRFLYKSQALPLFTQ